jgi:hypothetical protein
LNTSSSLAVAAVETLIPAAAVLVVTDPPCRVNLRDEEQAPKAL